MALTLTSPAFNHNEAIPSLYTCEGKNLAPPLEWHDIPPLTESLVLIVDDPDVPDPAEPRMVWVHWVLYNIPPQVTDLPKGAKSADLPQGTGVGGNDSGHTDYDGPCPPIGTHRYFFKLYALDTRLDLSGKVLKDDVLDAMKGHVLAEAELIGTYRKR